MAKGEIAHYEQFLPLLQYLQQEAQEGQYRSTAIRQKLNLQTAPPSDGHVFDQSTWLEGI